MCVLRCVRDTLWYKYRHSAAPPFAVELEARTMPTMATTIITYHDRCITHGQGADPGEIFPGIVTQKKSGIKVKRYDSDWRYRRGWGDDRDSRH
jgi:hypothetical protein